MDHGEAVGPLAPGDTVDRYEVLDLIGTGGTAAVWRARHRELGSVHAIKVLVLDRPSLRSRLLAEAQVQASIRHPNLVAVTDIVRGPHDEPALVLEHVRGPSLGDLLARRRLRLAEVDLLVRGILRGMAAAHGASVVHRDLKPANVLLQLADGRLVPKITDFGLVKLIAAGADASRTQVGTAMGTPEYMPPEQFADASTVDARADVWALGVMMYELCTGRLPFEAKDRGELFRRLSTEAYEPPIRRAPDLPDRMISAITGALRASPDRRFPDAAALLEAWCGEVPDEWVWVSFGQEAAWDPDTLAAAEGLCTDDTPDWTSEVSADPGTGPTLRTPPAKRSAPSPAAPTELRGREQPRRLGLGLAIVGALILTSLATGLAGVAVGLSASASSAPAVQCLP